MISTSNQEAGFGLKRVSRRSFKNGRNRFGFLLGAGLYFWIPLAAIMLLCGCGENKNIIPASSLTSGQVTLALDDVSNATSYNIYWSIKKGVTKQNGTKISNVKNPHTITGLKKGSTYYFVVTAVNESGESAVSESISHTVDK